MPLTFLIWIGRRYEMIFGDRLLIFLLCFGICVAFLLGDSDCVAQASRVGATLEGTVMDRSGAAMPGSRVMIRNTLTGQSRIVTTNEHGFFRAEQLAVSVYEVQVAQAGFAAYRNSGIVLSLGQNHSPRHCSFPSGGHRTSNGEGTGSGH